MTYIKSFLLKSWPNNVTGLFYLCMRQQWAPFSRWEWILSNNNEQLWYNYIGYHINCLIDMFSRLGPKMSSAGEVCTRWALSKLSMLPCMIVLRLGIQYSLSTCWELPNFVKPMPHAQMAYLTPKIEISLRWLIYGSHLLCHLAYDPLAAALGFLIRRSVYVWPKQRTC